MPANPHQKIIETLQKRKNRIVANLDKQGGRGISLADEIDRLDLAIDALTGELHCPLCEARLTSARNA